MIFVIGFGIQQFALEVWKVNVEFLLEKKEKWKSNGFCNLNTWIGISALGNYLASLSLNFLTCEVGTPFYNDEGINP